jgi:WD40 repeat protein/energy-coupling factor transporter ATP-binding protein EcfA2
MQKVFNEKNYYLMAACRGSERAREGNEHGVFTAGILNVLQAKIKEGERIDLDLLFSEVSAKLQQSGQAVTRTAGGGSITLIEKARGNVAPVVNENCPYVGLQAFDQNTAKYFCGRDRQIDLLLSKIEASRFVPVIGASGSGKSSLVKAGLIPALEKQGGWCILPPIKPWTDPLAILKKALVEQFYKLPTEIKKAYAKLESEGLNAILPEGSQRVLLVVDQFEELFTVCANEEDRKKFIRLLAEGADREGRLTIATTMRADFVEQALQYADLAKLIRDRAFWLVPLEPSEIRKAIAEPAKMQGYDLTEGLLEVICQDVEAEKNSLPLLEFALTELWERRDRQNYRLTLNAYTEMRSLRGALNRHAKDLYEKLASDVERAWTRRLFLQLVRTGQDVRDTRQRQAKQFLLGMADSEADQEMIANLLEIFAGADGRLLTMDEEHNVAFVDLAHEALMDSWEMFRDWRSQDRDLRRLGDRVKDAFDEWIIKDKLQDYLLPRSLIIQVNTNENELSEYLSEDQHEFYKISKEHENQKDIVLNWARTKPLLVEKIEKLQNSISINPLHKLLHSIQLIDENLQEQPNELLSIIQGSLLKSIQQFVDGNSPENIVSNESAFLDQQDSEKRKTNLVIAVCRDHDRTVRSVAFSPNGEMIVSGSADSYLRLWNLNGTMIGQPFRGHEDEVLAVAFSPNGEMIVSASEDKYLRLWNLEGNMIGLPFNGHSNAVKAVAFNRDSTTIASGSRDKTLCLWDLQGNLMQKPFEHENGVLSLDFSRDGRKLISCSANLLYLWNLQGVILRKFEAHTSTVRCISVSPDGKIIATGSDDKTIRLWDFEGNLISSPFRGHDAPVWSVSFSADGKTIVSGSDDKKIRLWDLQGKRIGLALDGHTGSVKSVIFSPIDNVIASGSVDKTLRIWHGGWQDWLEIACNRLRYHPVFKDPADNLAREACEVCRKYVWDKEKVEG